MVTIPLRQIAKFVTRLVNTAPSTKCRTSHKARDTASAMDIPKAKKTAAARGVVSLLLDQCLVCAFSKHFPLCLEPIWIGHIHVQPGARQYVLEDSQHDRMRCSGAQASYARTGQSRIDRDEAVFADIQIDPMASMIASKSCRRENAISEEDD